MIIKSVKNYFELRRENKKEINRLDQVIEDHGIDFDEGPMSFDSYELTPENVKGIMDIHGIDQGTAASFLSVMSFLTSPGFQTIVALGLSQHKSTKKIVNRVEMLTEFHQALMDVTDAMLKGKIKTNPEKVRDGLVHIFAKAFHPNESSFYCALNELKNIANGMATF